MRRPTRLLLAVLLVPITAGIWPCHAQDAGGSRSQEKPGIAMVKPQAWSKENESTVTEFLAITDRTVMGAAGAGYYEFRTKSNARNQIPSGRVIRIFIYPDMNGQLDMTGEDQRAVLENNIKEIQAFIAKYPSSKAYIDKYLKQYQADAAEYDSGKVRADGKWVPKKDYIKEKSANLVNLLRADLKRAKRVSNLDIENDPRYLALQRLAATNPEVKPSADEITFFYQTLMRQEDRNRLLDTLNVPNLSMEDAERAVGELRKLKPEEDEKSTAYLKSWDDNSGYCRKISVETARLQEALEKQMAEASSVKTPPELPNELVDEILAVNKAVRDYLAASPPSQLTVPTALATALEKFTVSLSRLKSQFEEKKFFDAKITIDGAMEEAHVVGSNSETVISSLGKYANRQTELFAGLKDEAKLQAASGKKQEALAKYEEAYAIIPDAGVADEIIALKK